MKPIKIKNLRKDSKMFPFVSCSINPLGGACPYNCRYCWAKAMIKRQSFEKYSGPSRIFEKLLRKQVINGDIIFVQSMSDLMAGTVKTRHILRVLDWIRANPETWFLLLTKNPERYLVLAREGEIPTNAILGATIETDNGSFRDQNELWTVYDDYSAAPPPMARLNTMKTLRSIIGNHLFISIEPIMQFSTQSVLNYPTFALHIKQIEPWAVAVGYDNYKHHLPESTLGETTKLLNALEKFTTVYRKSIRPAWWENIE